MGSESGEVRWFSGNASSSTQPRVNPSPTRRVTEVILPVKSRTPCSEARREVTGSCLRERERAMERPIFQAVGL